MRMHVCMCACMCSSESGWHSEVQLVMMRWVNVFVGRLTKEQIKGGYSALQHIANCVDKGESGARLTAACNDFYTRIPHYFGFAPLLFTTPY